MTFKAATIRRRSRWDRGSLLWVSLPRVRPGGRGDRDGDRKRGDPHGHSG